MTRKLLLFGLLFLCANGSFASNPSSGAAEQPASATDVGLPRLIRFSGTLPGNNGSVVGVTFALYKDQNGGSPLWVETQNVKVDSTGHYVVLLGSTNPGGLPADLFTSNDAQWLGVKSEGQEELARVLLVSVPYALKAGDAETLGGKPLSAFVLNSASVVSSASGSTGTAVTNSSVTPVAAPRTTVAVAAAPVAAAPLTATQFADNNTTSVVSVTQAGTGYGLSASSTNRPAVFGQSSSTTGAAFYGQSTATTGGAVGIRGDVASNAGIGVYGISTSTSGRTYGVRGDNASSGGTGLIGFATSTTGSTVGLQGQVSSTSGTALVGQASATSGSTKGVYGQVSSASGIAGVFNNLNGGKVVSVQNNFVEKLSIDASGNTVAAGSLTAASFTGDGSALTNVNAASLGGNAASAFVTAVNVGTGITGGGSGGTPTVALDQTFTDGRYAKLSGGNSLVGNQAVTGTVAATGQVSGSAFNAVGTVAPAGRYYVNGSPIIIATTGSTVGNLFMGDQAGLANTTGQKDLFDGAFAGTKNTTGSNNTFVGPVSGEFNTDGNENTFIGFEAGGNNNHGSGNTYIGMNAALLNEGDKNVYVGHNAGVGEIAESNTMRLGSSSEVSQTFVAGVTGVSVGGSSVTTNVALLDSNGQLGTDNSGSSTTGVQIGGVFGTTVDNGTGIAVVIDSTGKLGTVLSSRRFKENIAPMGDVTDGLFKLRPVTFLYKPEVEKSPKRYTQYGLIAEEVAQVYPDLVVYDKEGKPYTVKYQYLTPMLLNEVQKQHTVIADQQNVIESQNQQIQNLEQRLERLERMVEGRSETAVKVTSFSAQP